jgi:hypothetical protein
LKRRAGELIEAPDFGKAKIIHLRGNLHPHGDWHLIQGQDGAGLTGWGRGL